MSISDEICDKTDCRLYGCFKKPSIDKVYIKLKEMSDKVSDSEVGFRFETVNHDMVKLYNNLQARVNTITRTCLMCEHFTKQDMYAIMKSKEAMELLKDV